MPPMDVPEGSLAAYSNTDDQDGHFALIRDHLDCDRGSASYQLPPFLYEDGGTWEFEGRGGEHKMQYGKVTCLWFDGEEGREAADSTPQRFLTVGPGRSAPRHRLTTSGPEGVELIVEFTVRRDLGLTAARLNRAVALSASTVARLRLLWDAISSNGGQEHVRLVQGPQGFSLAECTPHAALLAATRIRTAPPS